MSITKRIGPIASPGPLMCFINHVPCLRHQIVFNITVQLQLPVQSPECFHIAWYSRSYTALYASVGDATLHEIQGSLLITP